MSSDDRNDPGPIWHGSIPSPWDPAPQEGMSEDFSYEQQQQQMAGLLPSAPFVDSYGEPLPEEPEEEEAQSAPEPEIEPEPAFAQDFVEPASFLQQIWYYAKLFLFPLLFGAVSALLVLPPIATGRAYLPSLMLWPMLVLIFLIVVAQVCFVYYTSPSPAMPDPVPPYRMPHMWLVGTLGSLSVLALIGIFAVLGPWPGVLVLLLVVLLGIYLVVRVFHRVTGGYVDIVFVGGEYRRTLGRGFHLVLPWEQVVDQVNVQETQWLCPPQRIQLSPEEDVILRALISYQLEPDDAHLSVTSVNNWEEGLRETFISALHTIATAFTPDDFLAWPQSLHSYQERRQFASDDFTGTPERRVMLNNMLFEHMRDRCASWGVRVNWVDLRNIEMAPHGFPALATELPDMANPVVHSGQPDDPTEILPPTPMTPALAGAQLAQTSASAQGGDQGATPPASSDRAPILSEETLAKLYKQVQTGKITDPATIRDIAASFEAVARDTQASSSVDFDAGRAAQNLYEQARRYEEPHLSKAFYEDRTRPELGASGGPSQK